MGASEFGCRVRIRSPYPDTDSKSRFYSLGGRMQSLLLLEVTRYAVLYKTGTTDTVSAQCLRSSVPNVKQRCAQGWRWREARGFRGKCRWNYELRVTATWIPLGEGVEGWGITH